MAVLRKRIGPGLTLLRTELFPCRLPAQTLRRGEREAWIGIGGNLGDVPRRFEHLRHALARSSGIRVLECSPILINPPFGYLEQPDFYNAVLRIATTLSPMELLRRLQGIERRFGRVRTFKDAPRTLDLDILFYGEQRVDLPDLQIPHPHWQDRDSVRLPLSWMRSRLPLRAIRKLKRRRGEADTAP
ncbi:2-amino-4-hydroxy-6-hydroxymethyldihydropteridine diphosphokinase [Nitratifractor salsuginis]|uniref:2-amino-4-hydroxy-6-hydroxymethyldihydropteridine pyrophosphokinase n=1 Tax=Nitratifractor salsuginis (strain DSM 16511 / JCM 12458 / E9I37-1) TaxID=749222 RepID=E6WZ85_NITSE|nr:2-amino-4-hydroxy-6-hydroxymethyldihydropteridine diphosphokinase [Nitratifractor salsuginis]ADV46597.1 2-amino-4-hydroxy-6-hydroxymethyldihydropteridine pyrophosphokinase [Nitratifractor salsuginis DSM 16511]